MSVRRLFFSSIRAKIIVPYLILTLLVAILGTYIITRFIARNLEERFSNQILEATRVAGDSVVRSEAANLETLRAMVFTLGMSDALAGGDAPALRQLVEPQAANAQLDGVIAVNAQGVELINLQAVVAPDGTRTYTVTQGRDLSLWPVVRPVLAGEIDENGFDKYAELVNTPAGMLLYTSGPVKNERGEIVGAILVGVSFDGVLQQAKVESLADVTYYGPDGLPVGSTFPGWNATPADREALTIGPQMFQIVQNSFEDETHLGNISLFQREFRASYAPLVVRGSNFGVIGVALPSNFIFQAANESRLTFTIFFSLATALVVGFGFAIAHIIVQPVLRLVQVTGAVAEGDFTQRVGIESGDELGMLARSFDAMTLELQDKTRNLQREAARVGAIVRSISDGIIVRDPSGKVILMNDAARYMLGHGVNFEDSPLALLQVTPSSEITERQWRGGLANRIELGDQVVSVRAAPVYTEGHEFVGNVLLMRDVTREVAAERLKDDFLNHISHELRTPLTVIKGYTDVLRTGHDKLDPVRTAHAMDLVFSNAQTLERMISQLIDLSEMAAGTLSLQLLPLDLNAFILGAIENWQKQIEAAQLEVKTEFEDAELLIEADERRLGWVIEALLENACQYSPRGGTLTITTANLEATAVVKISDEGVGISAEDLPNVFDRFYRGHAVDTANNAVIDPRGMGQGLYVVKSVVDAHGGRVWVDSESGHGTTFILLIPVKPV